MNTNSVNEPPDSEIDELVQEQGRVIIKEPEPLITVIAKASCPYCGYYKPCNDCLSKKK